jgi:hypothetical protein
MNIKEMEMRFWKYDADSYFKTKKMRDLSASIGRDTTWYDNHMKEIRDRWPNVKNWN